MADTQAAPAPVTVTVTPTPAGVAQPKNFIHISDFYNFIKEGSGGNSPTTFYYFTVNFFNSQNDEFNQEYKDYFQVLRYCVQSLSFPKISLQSYNGTASSNAVVDKIQF